MGEKPKPEEPVLAVKVLSRALGNVTIVKKGPNDIISDGENGRLKVKSLCGGQKPIKKSYFNRKMTVKRSDVTIVHNFKISNEL